MLCYQLLFKIAILGVLCSVGRSKSLLEVTESSTDTIPDTTIEPLESTNTTEDDLIQLTTLSDPDHDTPDDVERIHHYHHHKDKDNDRDKIIIVQQNPSRPNYEYDQYCYGQNEVWSTSIKCDVRCDYEGNEDDDRYGYGHYRGQNKDYLRYSCYRTVSDVDLEEGKINVTSLEALGYPPEPKEHFEARTIDLDMVKQLRGIPLRHRDHYDDDDDHYLVLQQNQPPYHRPAGRCVCRPDHARLNGKCVSRRYCPSPKEECVPNSYYSHCGPTCEPDCKTDLTKFEYTCGSCKRGCFCTKGFVRNWSGKCVVQSQCTAAERG